MAGEPSLNPLDVLGATRVITAKSELLAKLASTCRRKALPYDGGVLAGTVSVPVLKKSEGAEAHQPVRIAEQPRRSGRF